MTLDGKRAISGSNDETLIVWYPPALSPPPDSSSGSTLHDLVVAVLHLHTHALTSAKEEGGGFTLTIHHTPRDLQTGEKLQRLKGHTEPVPCYNI